MSPKDTRFWVYILHCANGTLYTGYTTDITKRYRSHLNGTSRCKYTKSFKVIGLAQCWQVAGDKSLALKIERYIKRLPRKAKDRLIASPEILALSFPTIQPFLVLPISETCNTDGEM